MILEKLKAYMQSGVGMCMGTVDARLKPEFQRVLGGMVVDNHHLRFFMDSKTAGRSFANIAENGKVCLVTCSPVFESYQFKGKCVEQHDATPKELDMVDDYFDKFGNAMAVFGLGEGLARNYPHTQMVSMLMEVEDVFEQTPKKGTGQKI